MTWRRTCLLLSVLLSFTAANVVGCVEQSNGSVGSVIRTADRSERDTQPAPAAAPVALATPTPTAAAPGPGVALRPPTPAPPVAPRYRVQGPGVDVPVVGTVGAPCAPSRPPVPWAGAYFDGCAAGLWIMAHPPFFGAMNGWSIGTQVTYWDGAAAAHVYHVVSSAVFAAGSTPPIPAGAVHFQVCTDNVAGSPVRVLGAS